MPRRDHKYSDTIEKLTSHGVQDLLRVECSSEIHENIYSGSVWVEMIT